MIEFIIFVFASYYLAFIITNTKGIRGMFEALREHLPLGGLTTCIYCLLPYSVAICFVLWWLSPPLVILMGIAGAGTFLHRVGDDF